MNGVSYLLVDLFYFHDISLIESCFGSVDLLSVTISCVMSDIDHKLETKHLTMTLVLIAVHEYLCLKYRLDN